MKEITKYFCHSKNFHYLCNLNYNTHSIPMKRRLLLASLAFILFVAGYAQTVVHITDPAKWSSADLKAYKGQTVTFDVPFYICSVRSGMTVSPRRLFSPTNQAIPMSDEYNSVISSNYNGSVGMSGMSGYHRTGERIENLTVKVTSISSLQYVSGKVVDNTREILSKSYPSISQKGTPTLVVCAFNLQYYLVENLGSGSQGPSTPEYQTRQHTKIMEALKHIKADVFGFVEVEQGQEALKKLAKSLSTETRRHYEWINDGMSANGTYTKSGYVYCAETVMPVGSMRSNETGVRNRKKMQAFKEIETGEVFIFSLNHFKAKSGTGTGANADQGDGQGIFNQMRKEEAQSVLNDYQTSKNFYDDEDILIMGDLNAYAKEDPIMILVKGGMTDLHRYFHADTSYSYVYDNLAGYLDHALANETMLSQVTGMTAYHINSDEDRSYGYTSSDNTMFRCSDHDPVIVGLRLGEKTAATSEIRIENGQLIIDHAADGYYRMYNMSGLLIYEGKITDDSFILPAQISNGLYFINVYTNGEVKQKKVMVM